MTIRTLAVVGSGHHMREHLRFVENVEVVGVFDLESASRRATSEVLGYVPVMVSAPEQLLKLEPDAVMIGSPDEFHPEHLAIFVRAGIPVLCEKPLAIDEGGLRLVRDTLSMAEAKNVRVASCHQRRSEIGDLPYGWIRANLAQLQKRFGELWRIDLNSNYPAPRQEWKQHRSFLADKFVHDIDFLRALLGVGSLQAQRLFDAHNHYKVVGSMAFGERIVEISCEGTRLHNDRDSFIECVMLNFKFGTCMVYTKTGETRLHGNETRLHETLNITPMIPDSYDRLNREVTLKFLNGEPVHTLRDLLFNTDVVVALAGEQGYYESR